MAMKEPPSRLFSKMTIKGKDGTSSRSKELNSEYPDLKEFELLDTLGTGTFGRVRLCRHSKQDKYFALKILKKNEIIRLKQVEHIISEKQILGKVDHPFIVKLYSTYKEERNLMMLMEFVPGGEIFSHLRKRGRFSFSMTRFYIASIVLAIQYLHAMDIVYRDLKPENLLLDERGYLKITDFGFAKIVPDRTWTLCGTPEYLAPEIITSKGHGKGVDWWALGILMFEMLAGYPPFFDENPFGIYQKILAGRIEFPRHFDAPAKDLERKLLSSDRTKRIGNLKNGAEDIKKHKWFKGFDFKALIEGKMPSEIVPDVKSAGDTNNFDKYADSVEDTSRPLVDKATAEKLFKDF